MHGSCSLRGSLCRAEHHSRCSAASSLDVPALEQAIRELIAAFEGVVIAPTEDDIAGGVFPPAAELASAALQRLQALALKQIRED